jgi:Fur family ferric uptake transcriptional regulator
MKSDYPMRMTRQRRVILDELRKMHTHPTADELYQGVRRRIPSISLATVYRNLKLLASTGFITEMQTVGAQRRYEGNVDNHYHLMCVACGRVDDATVPPDHDLQEAVDRTTGYKILSHRIEFLGVCPECSKTSANHPSDSGI